MKMKKVMAVFLLVTSMLSGFAHANLTDGLVAYYPFSGNANDESGNGNNGTVYGATLTNDRFGESNKAYSFDGSDYMDFGNSESINIALESISIMFWINAPVQDSGLISKNYEVGHGMPGYNIQCENSPEHNIGIRMDIDDGSNVFVGMTAPGTGVAVLDNNWHFVTMIIDRNLGQARAYLDGNLMDVKDISVLGSLMNNRNLLFGWRGDWWYLFNGLLDDVRIYNRVLSESEIQQLYMESQGELQEVSIDIKPGSMPNSINPKSSGKIPVAILSKPDFDASASVNINSLTFGHAGTETSLAFCNSEDVNGDDLNDLMCHFYTQQTGFQAGDTTGTLKGLTTADVQIVGQDSVNIVGK